MTTKRAMPAWLQDQLIADSVMTEHHVTRKIRARRCRACRATCLAAIDDTGCESWVDPIPLTVEGEMFALLAGRATFMAFAEELCTRDAGRIAHRDANAVDVFAQHRCGAGRLPGKYPPLVAAFNPDQPPY